MASATLNKPASPDDPLTLSSLTSERRIPHLETNSYIYQDGLRRPLQAQSDRYTRPLRSPRLSVESLRESIDRKLVDRELELRESRGLATASLQGKLQDLDYEIERQLERSKVMEIEGNVQRRQQLDSRNRIRAIEETIEERTRAEHLKSAQSPARRTMHYDDALLEQMSNSVASENHKKRPKSRPKYEFLTDKYSKYNTKSPYAKSTFSHDVRSMENQAYTYQRSKASEARSRADSRTRPRSVHGRADEELDFLRKVLALAELHAQRCPDLRIELGRIRRQFGQTD